MSKRREFIGQVMKGTAALAATRFFPASRVLGANDRVRLALIGAGLGAIYPAMRAASFDPVIALAYE